MVIYLRHPVHGTKVAISNHEAEYDKKIGWEVFDPTKKVEQPIAKKEDVSEIPVNELAPKPRGRRRKTD